MSSTIPVFAQSDVPFLTVKTDDNHYDEGDTVVISGQVATVIPGTPIILQVWFEESLLVEADQFDPAQDGSFSTTIIAEGDLWRNEGEYLVRVSHGEGNIAETSVEFTPKKEVLETKDSFEVQIPNGGTFDVEYSIKGGILKEMILIPDDYTLEISIEAPDEGSISIKLPRESIDAEKPNGQDEIFIVLLDNVQFPYEETETDNQSRLITINFEEGTSIIEVIGTFAIPEFGSMVMAILLIGIVSIIGISKNKFQIKI
ncbi:MAG: PEFG-CTERM sorting domain-containing protein [Nitrosopumilaceae archaeon]